MEGEMDTSIGDRITGRCVRTGDTYAGEIVAIYRPRPGCGYTETRYRLSNTGWFWSCGSKLEPVVVKLF
jgi:hypothetical protein